MKLVNICVTLTAVTCSNSISLGTLKKNIFNVLLLAFDIPRNVFTFFIKF